MGCAWLALALGLALVPPAQAATPDASARERLARLKALEREILFAEPAEELREGPSLTRVRLSLRRVRELDGTAPPLAPTVQLEAPPAWIAASAPANHRLNDPATEHAPFSTQAEPSLAAIGLEAVAAWNDGEILVGAPSGLTVGGSRDGGQTWRKFGDPPLANGVGVWTSDPVVAADEARGCFYVCGLVVTTAPRNGIAVVRASYADSGLVFGTPVVTRAVRDTLPDKPWLAADSLSGRLYLVYTSFFAVHGSPADQIEFQRSEDGGRSWSPPAVLSAPSELGMVHGARVATGPDGELHVIWKSLDTTLAGAGRDWIRIRSSRDGGRSFGPSYPVSDFYTNYGSGAPGFNRPWGFTFPSLAVDRSRGPFRGRIYAAWNESVAFFEDTLGGGGAAVVQRSSDDTRESVTPFVVGQTLRGRVGGGTGLWQFHAERGQTVVFWLDSLTARLDASMRLYGLYGATTLATSAPPQTHERLIVLTIPASGEYFLRVTPMNPISGAYRIVTAFHHRGAERARDHRDVFVTHSDDGFRWSPPVRLSDDPPWFDDWLPEVAVSATGKVVASWYGWQFPAEVICGSWSQTTAAVSSDGGESWTPSGPVSDAWSPWPQVQSNQEPNQGDYMGLTASGDSAWIAWSDGRSGNPDVYAAVIGLSGQPAPRARTAPLALDGPWPHPARGPLAMRVWLPADRPATVELLDAAGRRWRTQRVSPRAAGWQWLDLGSSAELPPGLYFARASQDGASASRRIVVLR